MSPNEAVYGSWPRSGEIDIFEAKGHDSNYLAANAHWGAASNNKRQAQGNFNVNTLSPNGTNDWHTYAVKWQEGRLDYYIDGQPFHTVSNFSTPNATTHPGPFNTPFYIRINLAIGGNYLTPPHNDAHNNSDKFPTTMEVDYVRVYQKSAANAEVVNIPDANLRRQINKNLSATTGAQRNDDQSITAEDMKNINHLDLNVAASAPANEKIADLTGLEKAVNLTRIALANHNVRSITPLAGLTHLTSIDLTGNSVTDISPLSGLEKLKSEDLKLTSQKPIITSTVASFPSPLKDKSGATIAVQDSSTVINDTNTAGNLKLVSPVYDGQMHTAQATWTNNVTIGGATTTFSGTLTVNTTLPKPVDISGLQAAIATAEAEPNYIKNDNDVKNALAAAKAVVAQANPSQADIQNATNNLNSAVAAAKQKERDAQAAAEAAVTTAERDKTQAAVDAARILINKVQDPAKKSILQTRLNAIAITNPNPTTPTTSATIAQPRGGSVTISTSGDKCYNLASAKAAPAPERYNNRTLRDIANFTINCTNQTAATGYTIQVTLTLSRRYGDTKHLIVAKIANGVFKEDITSHVTFGTSSDGKYTTISYSLTDGGFGDEDKAANGVIIDPIGIYEENTSSVSTANASGSVSLANTGDSLLAATLVATTISLAGAVLVLLKRR